jgi:hypothetical protein
VEDHYNDVAKILETKQKGLGQTTVANSEEGLKKGTSKKVNLTHTYLSAQNKFLNTELDDYLLKAIQLQNINKVLQKNIEYYIASMRKPESPSTARMTELLRNINPSRIFSE